MRDMHIAAHLAVSVVGKLVKIDDLQVLSGQREAGVQVLRAYSKFIAPQVNMVCWPYQSHLGVRAPKGGHFVQRCACVYCGWQVAGT